MKKTLSLLMTAALVLAFLTGCGAGSQGTAADKDRLRIVATIFPEYDWVMNILGENPAGAEVTLLLDSGVDMHSYQPTADDMLKISSCDLFIYVGGESDQKLEDALKTAAREDLAVIRLLDVLGDLVKEEEMAPGMQEEAHGHEEAEADEHVWLSLHRAAVLTAAISEAVQKLDPDRVETYQKNTESYTDKLKALDAAYQAAVSEASFHTLIFGDRFPFRYLTDDYGLEYYAAFSGCSAESEASFETISFLAQKADELSVPAVMAIEGSDQRIAQTVVQNTKRKDLQILVLDSMQSAGAAALKDGTSYLSVMEKNLSVLKNALN